MGLLLMLAYPLFLLIHHEDSTLVLFGELGFAVLVALTSGAMVALNVELMPDQIRCTGLSVAYNLAHGLFGGTTPLIAAWLLKITDDPLTPVLWVAGTLTVSTLTLMVWIRSTHLHPFIETSGPRPASG